jgi:hypothetical protein
MNVPTICMCTVSAPSMERAFCSRKLDKSALGGALLELIAPNQQLEKEFCAVHNLRIRLSCGVTMHFIIRQTEDMIATCKNICTWNVLNRYKERQR